MKEKFKKIKNKIALSFRRLGQFTYITFAKYFDNYLGESASACSFGFIFSFIPVVMIIVTVLVTILQFSPNFLNAILDFCATFESYYNFKPIVDVLVQTKSITFLNIILGIWVVWMARKLFVSVTQGIQQIFRSVSKRKDIFYQLFYFLSEFVLVFIFIIVILLTFTFDKFIRLPLFNPIRNAFPNIFNESTHNASRIMSFIMYLMFFLFTFYCYRFVSGTKPKVKICFFYAALSTVAFAVVSFFLGKFMNLSNYNIVYGTVSTVIVLLFKVYMFFITFFFCGEMVYVSQNFDNLLLAQIYILSSKKRNKKPSKKGNNKSAKKKHNFSEALFGNPILVTTKTENIKIPAGTKIFENHETPEKIFYILNGIVKESRDDFILTHSKGDFFGELPTLLHKNYKTTAIAKTDCELMLIDVETFHKVVQQNKEVSAEAIKKINKYTGENNIL